MAQKTSRTNPHCQLLKNILIGGYMITLTFYLFNDWFIYQIQEIQNDKPSDLSSTESLDM